MLQDKLKELAKKNRRVEEMQDLISLTMELLEQTQEWQDYQTTKEKFEEVKQEIEDLRAEINDLTLDEYEKTGNKKPVSGVSIRIYKKVDYEDEIAFEWCMNHLQPALKIDKTKLEKHLKAIEETAPPNWCVYYEEPKPTIASDLKEYI